MNLEVRGAQGFMLLIVWYRSHIISKRYQALCKKIKRNLRKVTQPLRVYRKKMSEMVAFVILGTYNFQPSFQGKSTKNDAKRLQRIQNKQFIYGSTRLFLLKLLWFGEAEVISSARFWRYFIKMARLKAKLVLFLAFIAVLCKGCDPECLNCTGAVCSQCVNDTFYL